MSFFGKNNRIFRKTLLGVFVMFLILIPAITVTPGNTESSRSHLSVGIVRAQESTSGAEIGTAVPSTSSEVSTPATERTATPAAPTKTPGSAAVRDAAATGDGFSLWQKGINFFINTIGTIIIAVPSAFAWFGGELLDISIKFSVLEMGANINSSTFGNSIDVMWKLVRDICNLIFIFGFIFTGIRTILDPENAETKRFVSRIIIGALLINFSLFFVKIVIDFSNFLAFQIYSAMMDAGGSISQTVANLLGIVTIYNVTDGNVLAKMTDGGKGFWFYVLAAIFLFITAFVFVVAAIMFLIRFVALVLIMVASPILFAANVFPQTAHFASDLWGKLISYSFFAPAYLLLTFISITLLQGLSPSLDKSGIATALTQTGVSGAFGVFLNFFIVIFFMIASLTIANKMGVKGGDFAIKLAGGATYGLAARMSRVTLGRYANHLSEKEGLLEAASKKSGLKGLSARFALKGTRIVADSSLDIRNAGSAGKSLGAGEGRKGGYKTVLGEVKKKEEEFTKSLGEVGDDDVRVKARKQEIEHAKDTLEKDEHNLSVLRKDLGDFKTELRNEEKKKGSDRDDVYIEKLKNDIKNQDKKIEKQLAHNKHQKHEVHEAEVRYAKEKQRRMIGSTYAKEDASPDVLKKIKENEAKIEDQKSKLESYWKEYQTITGIYGDEIKKGRREILAKKMKELKDLEKEHQTFMRENLDGGYAGVLYNGSIITSWPLGRLVHMDAEAGKAIWKARESGHPKEKDDHGGGHGAAHGGGGGGGDGGHGGGHGAAHGGGGGGHAPH